MGSTLSDLEGEAKDQEKISLGVSVFCCCMIVCVVMLWIIMRYNSGSPVHHLSRSMGRMPYGPPRMPSYGPGRFSASSPMMRY
jgi:hypothetical protein